MSQEVSGRDEEADRHPRRRNRRDDDRQPAARRFDPDEAEIHVVDRDDRHVYQPGPALRPVRAGADRGDRAAAPAPAARRDRLPRERRRVRVDRTRRGAPATTAPCSPTTCSWSPPAPRLQPEETEGLTGPGWNERVFTFYTPEGADAAPPALESFDGGRLVVNLVDMPIKCPVAPLEFAFLADWYLRERGVRDRRRARLLDPARRRVHEARRVRAPGRPARARRRSSSSPSSTRARWTASAAARLLRRARARLRPARDGAAPRRRRLRRALARARRRARVRARPTSGRCRRPRRRTCSRSATRPTCPTSKAGSVTHFEGEVLTENVARFLAGKELDAGYDGHANCFIETGFSQGPADRLQLRHRAAPGPLPDARRAPAAAARVAPEPPRQAHVPVGLLARRCCRGGRFPGSGRPCRPRASRARRDAHDMRRTR